MYNALGNLNGNVGAGTHLKGPQLAVALVQVYFEILCFSK